MKSPEKTQPTPTAEESHQPAGEHAARLLQAFVADGRSEAAFQKIVDRFGALVFSSALRRTGDSGLAEEVAQNVFTALAQKAATLTRHKTLLAWIFKATSFEASKALRAESSRLKKHAAAAAAAKSEQLTNMATPDEAEPWRDAVPLLDASLDELCAKDRQLVLERFYEGKKFAEIASENGTTEAASKMRVKRALEKLGKSLTARGVGLSSAAIATALGSELAKAAPANAMTGVASNALAASSAAGTSFLTINTIEFMSTVKTATVTSAAVIALAATPLLIQQTKANKLEDELNRLNEQRIAAEGKISTTPPASVAPASKHDQGTRTVHDLLASGNEQVDLNQLIDRLVAAMSTQDVIGMIEVFLPISDLDPDEYEDLIAQLENYQGSQDVKRMFTQMLTIFSPSGNYGAAIERMFNIGAEPYSYARILAHWGKENPAGAIKWFREKLASGELQGTGIRDMNEAIVFSKLIGGVARTKPSTAVDLLFEFAGDNPKQYDGSYDDLAAGLGSWMAKDGNEGETELKRLLAWSDDPSFRTQVLRSVIRNATEPKDIPTAIALVDTYVDDPELRTELVVERISSSGLDISEQAQAAQKHLPSEDLTEAIGYIVNSGWFGMREGIDAWIADQPEGEIRDAAYESLSRRYSVEAQFAEALATAEQIGDADKRDKAMQTFAERWYRKDEEAARAALPANIISALAESE